MNELSKIEDQEGRLHVYLLVDEDGDEVTGRYATFDEARQAATERGKCAVARRTYEYAEESSEWRPSGERDWPFAY